jgi:hypothetical protein
MLLLHRGGKDAVIQAYHEKFQDYNFGHSQYRYLRGEVGTNPTYG